MALDSRAAAALVIGEVLGGQSLNQALPRHIDGIEARERSLVQELCYGTLRQGPRLIALTRALLEKPLKDRDRDLQALLLLGLYQLDNMRVPDHAAVAATVSATRALKKSWAKNLVNAVLRRYQRERGQLLAGLQAAPAACHPQWLYDEIHRQWPEQATAIIEANNSRPPMTLRVNARHSGRDAYLQALGRNGIDASPGLLSGQALILRQPLDVSLLPGFREGAVSIQDEAAQLAAALLQVKPGEQVLDACAAPGGKTCHLLEIQPEIGGLVAMDADERRLSGVAENLSRLHLHAKLVPGDATRPPTMLQAGSFDCILADAPCSATGVIRRHPDVKLLRREQDIPRFADLQLAILRGLWPLLKPGGRLLYATCSILRQENEGAISAFLALQRDASAMPLGATFGVATGAGRQLLPRPGGPDGLYYALLAKSSG